MSLSAVEPELVLINGLNTWFGSVVGCETFHADVHAGNLLVLPDGRVAFIDFGIVGRIRYAHAYTDRNSSSGAFGTRARQL